MATIPITKRGAEILKAELHRLKTVDRPAVIGAISEARAQGDLSENAEYDAAKDRQGFIEGRIQEVEGKLSVAQVIDPAALDAGGRVVFGTTVDLEAEESGDRVHALFSPYSYHYSRDPDHRHVWLVGTERERANGALAGAVLFSNSFGQPTIYAYPWGGIVKDVMGVDRLFVKWTAGILYGYRRPFENKVPLNYQGFSPGIIPAVGWQFEGGQQFQVNLFGGAGFMLQFSAQIK